MKVFVDLLKAPDFIGKVLLLLITAALTGILVPEISAELSENRFREQKLFEADLQRQREILSAQNDLLNTLSERLWELVLLKEPLQKACYRDRIRGTRISSLINDEAAQFF